MAIQISCHAQQAMTLSIVSKLTNLLNLKAFHGVDKVSHAPNQCAPLTMVFFFVDLSSPPPNYIKYCNFRMEGTTNIVKKKI